MLKFTETVSLLDIFSLELLLSMSPVYITTILIIYRSSYYKLSVAEPALLATDIKCNRQHPKLISDGFYLLALQCASRLVVAPVLAVGFVGLGCSVEAAMELYH
jgi:hypothetical protein